MDIELTVPDDLADELVAERAAIRGGPVETRSANALVPMMMWLNDGVTVLTITEKGILPLVRLAKARDTPFTLNIRSSAGRVSIELNEDPDPEKVARDGARRARVARPWLAADA